MMPGLFGRTGVSGSAWVPTDISGCVSWLRGDLGITEDGANLVGSWATQAGAASPFTQTTDANKPTHVENAFNGQAGVSFPYDAVNPKWMKTTSLSLPQPCSLFVVAVNIDVNTQASHTFLRDGAVSALADILNAYMRIYAGASIASVVTSIGQLADHIYEYQFNGDSSKAYLDKTSEEISGSAGAGGFAGTVYIAANSDTPGQTGIFTIMEIVGYTPIPSSGNRDKLYTYFNTRYGL